MPEVYRLLDQDAKSWWWHQELRRAGLHEEARRQERKWIREQVRSLRHAFFLRVGYHGDATLYLTPTPREEHSVHGLDPDLWNSLLRQVRPDVPIVDTRWMDWELAFLTALQGPLCAIRESDRANPDGTWGPCQRAPLAVYLAIWEAAGASVHWGRYLYGRRDWRRLAEPTIRRLNLPVATLA